VTINLRKVPKGLKAACALGFAYGFLLLKCYAELQQFERCDFAHPDFFPILPWSPLRGWDGKAADFQANGLASIAECGFNMSGFVGPADLPECEQRGLGAIVLSSETGLRTILQKKRVGESEDEIENWVKRLIQSAGSSRAIVGYFIMDEPGVKHFPALAKAVATVKKHAPGKLAYINLFPNYATLGAPDTSQLGTSNYTEYLERFITEVKPQVLSYDNYMVQYSNDLKESAGTASYFLNIEQVRQAGTKHNLPCLQIVASNQLRPDRAIPTPGNMLVQAYTTLAAGFKGVTWYTYYGRRYNYAPIDDDGRRTETWHYLRQVNRQVASLASFMPRLRSTGVYYTNPPEPTLNSLPGKLIRRIESSTPMMVGEFTGPEGSLWAMVVNLDPGRSAKFRLEGEAGGTFLSVSTVDGRLRKYEPAKDGYWLMPGQGVLLKVAQ
jgi:hypothetical protein